MGPSRSRERFARRIRLRTCGVGMGFLLGCCIPARTQESVSPRTDPPLILTGTIALPNVDGRIDHFALDPGGRIFVCVIGNDTVEVLETLTEKRVHTITGVPHPQGVVYVQEFTWCSGSAGSQQRGGLDIPNSGLNQPYRRVHERRFFLGIVGPF
jgi:hypothetical protein